MIVEKTKTFQTLLVKLRFIQTSLFCKNEKIKHVCKVIIYSSNVT